MDDEDDGQAEAKSPRPVKKQQVDDESSETSVEDELALDVDTAGVFELLHQAPQRVDMANISARYRRKISNKPLFFEDDVLLNESVYFRCHTLKNRLYYINSWTGMQDILRRVYRDSVSSKPRVANSMYSATGLLMRAQKSDARSYLAAQREQLRRTTNKCINEPVAEPGVE